MKITYISAQSKTEDKDFSGKPAISFAAARTDVFPLTEPYVETPTFFYGTGNINSLFETLKDCNVCVCFHTYCIDLLQKYSPFDNPIEYNIKLVSLSGIIEDEIEQRVYMNTVGKALGINRKVFNGKSYISLWKNKEDEKIKDCIYTDINIIRESFVYMMENEYMTLTHPYNDKQVKLYVGFVKDYVRDINKGSYNERYG